MTSPNHVPDSHPQQGKDKNLHIHAMRLHRVRGQAFVILNGKTLYLGRHGLEETELSHSSSAVTPSSPML